MVIQNNIYVLISRSIQIPILFHLNDEASINSMKN